MDTGVAPTQGNPDVIVAESPDALYQRAADEFVAAANGSKSPDGMFTVALSGGNTPRALYELLAQEPYASQVPWDRTQVFFSDERFVPLDSAESNGQMASEALLSKVPIPERFVHRIATADTSPDEAAAIYEEGIRRILKADLGEVPSFDLILLGLGPDGHTASLFPNTDALAVEDRLVVANYVPDKDSWRITFTYPLIDAARTVMFLIEGEGKAEIASRVLAGGDYPAARVHPTSGRLLWLLDKAAAGGLSAGQRAG